MPDQRSDFDPPQPPGIPSQHTVLRDRYEAALIASAAGDALGWPMEFKRRTRNPRAGPKAQPHEFVSWKKNIGGRWWGYQEEIAQGEYSDDTQLGLAVARCIAPSGEFEPRRFAYSELPLWLHYERGGGKSLKAAAHALLKPRTDWHSNFYKRSDVDYRRAGGNGAAMRDLPIALASLKNEDRLIGDSFANAIITHGHPRAIIGAILFALAVRHAGTYGGLTRVSEDLSDVLTSLWSRLIQHSWVEDWVHAWDRGADDATGTFRSLFQATVAEAHDYLGSLHAPGLDTEGYYGRVGAYQHATKGSGLGTVCAALYVATHTEKPSNGIFAAANQLGSDTDTIAYFVGSILGTCYGLEAVPPVLGENVQDLAYLRATAERLHQIASGSHKENIVVGPRIDRKEAYLRILAWEIGLHEMFWDALSEGDHVLHPALGRGFITSKSVRNIARQGYVAKLFGIDFDCGQSCVFRSRVATDLRIEESIGKQVSTALNDELKS